MDPDFEYDFSRAVGPVRGVFKLDQMRAFLDEFFGLWETVRFEVDELVEAGDQIAASFTNYHRGRDGIEVTVHPSVVWTMPRRTHGASLHVSRVAGGPRSRGLRSKTLTPTPEPAGYCAGDVAGERGDGAPGLSTRSTSATSTPFSNISHADVECDVSATIGRYAGCMTAIAAIEAVRRCWRPRAFRCVHRVSRFFESGGRRCRPLACAHARHGKRCRRPRRRMAMCDRARRKGRRGGATFNDRAEALEAVGLSEQDAHADS